jgi:hypothetical protein
MPTNGIGQRYQSSRRTVATVMADKLAMLPHVIEATLNHVGGHKAGVAGIYNRGLRARGPRRTRSCSGDRAGIASPAAAPSMHRAILRLRPAAVVAVLDGDFRVCSK